MMNFVKIESENKKEIEQLSAFAGAIVKEVFDPLIGEAQNDYMINLFQSVQSIQEQLLHGYQYYYVYENDNKIGFLAFYERTDEIYLSKFYLEKGFRGRGYSRQMFDFVCSNARNLGYTKITLNVNRNNPARFVYEKLGMKIIREEKNDIGNGFYMDDYVYAVDMSDF